MTITAPPPARARHTVLVAVLVVAALGLAVALVAGNVRPHAPTASPMGTMAEYVAAVQGGDRAALERLVPESSPQRRTLLDRHAGHPASISTMTLDSTPSSAFWTFTVTYHSAVQPMPTEHLMVGVRPGLTPDDAAEWAVTSTDG